MVGGRGEPQRGLRPWSIFVELYSFGADFNGTIEPTAYTETPATAREILADHTAAAPPRMVSLVNERNSPFDWHGGWAYDLESYRRYNETLRMYSGGLYGLANALPGWSPLHLYRHGEFARGYPAFAALAGVEYAVRYSRERGFEVQRLPTALPRAYVVGQFHLATSPRAGLSYMARGFPMRREVVLEEAPVASIGAGRRGGDRPLRGRGSRRGPHRLGRGDFGLERYVLSGLAGLCRWG